MRNVVTFIAIKLFVRLMVNMLEVAIVYIVARTLFFAARKGVRWSYGLAASGCAKLYATTRAAKAKTRKLVTHIPPPSHAIQRFPLDPIPESPGESELSEPEDSRILG